MRNAIVRWLLAVHAARARKAAACNNWPTGHGAVTTPGREGPETNND